GRRSGTRSTAGRLRAGCRRLRRRQRGGGALAARARPRRRRRPAQGVAEVSIGRDRRGSARMSSPKSLLVRDDRLPAGLIAIPLRTRLVRPGDDLVALTEEAVCGIARAGDVVAVAESAVAIAQGEFLAAEHVRPSRLAYAIARRADPMATISQPESIQLVIDRAGAWK